MIDYDSELRLLNHAFRHVLDVRQRDHVLDIGCGAGQTTREVAAMASLGRVLGIDTAESMLEQARLRTLAAGLRNVDYVCADAAQHSFVPASIDIAISRFGTMFFTDAVRAFTNIRAALRPDGRLIMMVWQQAHENEWAVAIHRALTGDAFATPAPSSGPSAFAFGDVRTVKTILSKTNFVDSTFEEVREPVFYGADVERALEFVSGFSTVTSVMQSQPASERGGTLARLRDIMTAHNTRDGVWFDSRAWIVKAKCG